MEAGKLRHRVNVQSNTGVRDRTGQSAPVWANIGATDQPVDIKTLRGDELVTAQQVVPHATHRVTMRYRNDVTPAQKMVFGSRELNIGHVENVGERNTTLLILCTEKK